MTYGDEFFFNLSKAPKAAQRIKNGALPEAGTKSFRKAGDEFQRLKELLLKHGTNVQNVQVNTVCAQDNYFLQFKPNSLKSAIAIRRN